MLKYLLVLLIILCKFKVSAETSAFLFFDIWNLKILALFPPLLGFLIWQDWSGLAVMLCLILPMQIEAFSNNKKIVPPPLVDSFYTLEN